MKKIMMALCLIGALCAFSQDNQTPPARREGARRAAHDRTQWRGDNLTPGERKERMERFRAEMKARHEATQKKIVDTLVEAGLSQEKAKETMEKIEKIYLESRPMRPGMGPGMGGRGPGMGPGGQGGRRGPRGPRAQQGDKK